MYVRTGRELVRPDVLPLTIHSRDIKLCSKYLVKYRLGGAHFLPTKMEILKVQKGAEAGHIWVGIAKNGSHTACHRHSSLHSQILDQSTKISQIRQNNSFPRKSHRWPLFYKPSGARTGIIWTRPNSRAQPHRHSPPSTSPSRLLLSPITTPLLSHLRPPCTPGAFIAPCRPAASP
jgi:hypothetical protein